MFYQQEAPVARCSIDGVLLLHLLLSHSSTSSAGPKTLSPLAPQWPQNDKTKSETFGVIWTLCHL